VAVDVEELGATAVRDAVGQMSDPGVFPRGWWGGVVRPLSGKLPPFVIPTVPQMSDW
jgi:hypothetical protein